MTLLSTRRTGLLVGPQGPEGPPGPPGVDGSIAGVPGTGLVQTVGGVLSSTTGAGDATYTGGAFTVSGLKGKVLPALVAGYLNYTGSAWALTALPTSLPPSGTAGGDLSGTYPNPTVAQVNGASAPAAGSLTTGNVLQVSGASSLTYAPVNLAGGANYVTGVLPAGNQASQTMGGDVTGTTAASTVAKIQGNTVTSGALTKGQFFVATSTTNWAATTLSGDLSESAVTAGLVTVVGIQGNTVTSGALTKGQFFVATSTSNWAATTLSGDISESATTAGQLTVAKVNGASAPAAGALTTGNVLQVNGASSLTYGAVNLAGGANYVTGVLPAGNQASQTMGGDVTGTTAASTVAKIQGNTVTGGALTKGQFFVATSTSNWAATALSGDLSESATTAGLVTVTGLQGVAVPAPSGTNTVLTYNGSTLSWAAAGGGTTAPVTFTRRTNTANSTYTIDSTGGGADYYIVHNKSGAVSYVLPALTDGRTLIIKDATDAINTPANNIFVVPHGNDIFDGAAAFALSGTAYHFTNGSASVSATSSKFTTELSVGMSIQSSNQSGTNYIVSAITDDTHLTLASNFSGTTTTTATATRTSLTYSTNAGALKLFSDGSNWFTW